MNLSLVMITLNEEAALPRCLASAAGVADEIVVVDSHSTDRTRDIAAEHGARVIERDWPGFGPQVSFAVSQASHDWVLRLDADEELSPELRASLLAWKQQPESPRRAYTVRRRDRAHDRWLRATEHAFIRLAHRDSITMPRLFVHETWQTAAPVGQLPGYLNHYTEYLYGDWMRVRLQYAVLDANEKYHHGQRARWRHLVFSPWWTFLRLYFVNFGCLDGWPGFFHAVAYANYTLNKYATLWELQRGFRQPLPVPERGSN